MKYVFVVQGEGRGHFTQALAMKDMLVGQGHKVLAVLVGKSSTRELPVFFTNKIGVPVYTFDSPNFLPTPKGRQPNILKSTLKNILSFPRFVRSIFFIKKKIDQYSPDFVINFYELMTGLTYFFTSPQSRMICIGHQYMFLHKKFIFPKSSFLSLFFLRFFTRLTCLGAIKKLALSFYDAGDDIENGIRVVPPLLRQEVFKARISSGDYIHGYMLNNGYVEDLQSWHRLHPNEKLHFFWDKRNVSDLLCESPNFCLHKIDDTLFLKYMSGCKAYATTAGFESVCEAMYMGKPILMVPTHIEQTCNAFDAQRIGAGVVADYFNLNILLDFLPQYKYDTSFKRWVESSELLFLRHITDVAADDIFKYSKPAFV